MENHLQNQKEYLKGIKVKLNKNTYLPNHKLLLIKGESFKDNIVGVLENLEKYTQVGDFFLLKERIFGKEYKLKVLKILINSNNEIIAIIENNKVPKNIIRILNNLKVKNKNESSTSINNKKSSSKSKI